MNVQTATGTQLILGDCRRVSIQLPGRSLDSIVTDPPYELNFMASAWDRSGVAFDPATWRAALRLLKPGGLLLAFGGTRTFHRLACAIEDAGFEIRDCIMWVYASGMPKSATQLKPAWEPILVARKPCEGTEAATTRRYGTGGMQVDAGSVPALPGDGPRKWERPRGMGFSGGTNHGPCKAFKQDGGRRPANLIHDGSEEVLALLGSAARYFYCAKAGPADRGEGNTHETVKPQALMRHLVRLATPRPGRVGDLFMGSGTTGVACALEGFDFVGITNLPDHLAIAERRIAEAAASARAEEGDAP